MGEPGGHYRKWNDPGTERQILHDLIHIGCLAKADSYKHRAGQKPGRAEEEGEKRLAMATKFQF